MKCTSIISLLAIVGAAVVDAQPTGETNSARLARGLPPNPPSRRAASGVAGARRATTSPTPSVCATGALQCCNSVTASTDPMAGLIISLLGIVVRSPATVGLTCSPVSSAGGSCASHAACCENNTFNGIIALGCTPVTLASGS